MTETFKPTHGAHLATRRHQQVAKSEIYKANPSGVVVGLALGMSWRLALVVIVPLLGGHALDNRWHKAPLWTVVGLALAMALMVLVVYRTLKDLRAYTETESEDDE